VLRPCVLALALLHSTAAVAAERLSGTVTATLATGMDSNPRRTVGESSTVDGFFGATGSARGRLLVGESGALSGKLELGLRKYLQEEDEDLFVTQLESGFAWREGRLVVGAQGGGKVRFSRARSRDYGDLSGEGFVEWALRERLSLRVGGGGRWFRYQPDHGYDSLGPRVDATLRYSPVRQVSLLASVTGGWPSFEGEARDSAGVSTGQRREDRHFGAHFAVGYRGPVACQAAYTWLRNASTSFGESTDRHRVSAVLSTALPGGLFGMVQAAYQHIRYSDGIFLSQGLLLLDEEAQSSAAAKLSWPLSELVELEGRYALYWIHLPPEREVPDAQEITYLRHTASVGFALRW